MTWFSFPFPVLHDLRSTIRGAIGVHSGGYSLRHSWELRRLKPKNVTSLTLGSKIGPNQGIPAYADTDHESLAFIRAVPCFGVAEDKNVARATSRCAGAGSTLPSTVPSFLQHVYHSIGPIQRLGEYTISRHSRSLSKWSSQQNWQQFRYSTQDLERRVSVALLVLSMLHSSCGSLQFCFLPRIPWLNPLFRVMCSSIHQTHRHTFSLTLERQHYKPIRHSVQTSRQLSWHLQFLSQLWPSHSVNQHHPLHSQLPPLSRTMASRMAHPFLSIRLLQRHLYQQR